MLSVQTSNNLHIIRLVLRGEDAMADEKLKHYATIGRREFTFRQCILQLFDAHECDRLDFIEVAWSWDGPVRQTHLVEYCTSGQIRPVSPPPLSSAMLT